jgi:hypothetical protein
VVAAMTEGSGAFLERRILQDVWPVVGRAIGAAADGAARRIHGDGATRAIAGGGGHRGLVVHGGGAAATRVPPRPESERALLESVAHCLARIFANRELGSVLSGLIPAAGAMLLPFLDEPGDAPGKGSRLLADACTDALRSMLRADSDALSRQLIELSGGSVPRCPLSAGPTAAPRPVPGSAATTTAVASAVPSSSRLAAACRELLEYADSLPEQPLDALSLLQ